LIETPTSASLGGDERGNIRVNEESTAGYRRSGKVKREKRKGRIGGEAVNPDSFMKYLAMVNV